MAPEDFWELTPDEAGLIIEAYWDRVEFEDKQTAHYTRYQMMPHLGKKTPSAKDMQFFVQKKSAEVTDVSTEERRQAVREMLAARNQKAG